VFIGYDVGGTKKSAPSEAAEVSSVRNLVLKIVTSVH
jgi:hypothetical protein